MPDFLHLCDFTNNGILHRLLFRNIYLREIMTVLLSKTVLFLKNTKEKIRPTHIMSFCNELVSAHVVKFV